MQVEEQVDSRVAETPDVQSTEHMHPPSNPPDSEDEIL